VTIPGLGRPGFDERAAAWFARVRRRQHFDLRPWFEAGRQALENQNVRTRLEDLERSLHTRLSRLRRIASAPGNLPAHNPRFVGRETEMRVLHESDRSSEVRQTAQSVLCAPGWHASIRNLATITDVKELVAIDQPA
jgi:hypothetical protein